jgi:glycosyltransferase involved in cell wall biosynthesis
MRIAVDARELSGRPTGVGRYLAELLTAWAAMAEARRHEWRFFAPAAVTLPPPFAGALAQLPGAGGTLWEQTTFARALGRDRADVVFAPGYTAPLTAPAPVALTVHDVSFAAHPEWFSFREGTRRRTLTAWSARRARIVMTDTEFSRDEIRKHLGVPADRVRVIPLGVSRLVVDQRPAAREPIILFVGSIFARRHVDRLIEVFVNHVAPAVPGSRLEIVGENRLPAGNPAAALRGAPRDVAERVTLRAYVDEGTLSALYERASVFAFLSEYEGFGLTPLEALSAGVPPVVLDTAVAREVYGPAARYVTSLASPRPLAGALIELLTSTGARDAILSHAERVLRRYDWRTTAMATLRAIEEAAGV